MEFVSVPHCFALEEKDKNSASFLLARWRQLSAHDILFSIWPYDVVFLYFYWFLIGRIMWAKSAAISETHKLECS